MSSETSTELQARVKGLQQTILRMNTRIIDLRRRVDAAQADADRLVYFARLVITQERSITGDVEAAAVDAVRLHDEAIALRERHS